VRGYSWWFFHIDQVSNPEALDSTSTSAIEVDERLPPDSLKRGEMEMEPTESIHIYQKKLR